MLSDLLALPGVVEHCELRGSFGVMAYHGGNLEQVTDVVATEVARRSGASLYTLVQPAPLAHHVPSTAFDPGHSARLAAFLDQVEVVLTVHGYGRRDRFRHLLLGGRNRRLARHLGSHLRTHLPEGYEVVDRLADIPAGLRGVHPRNPVNLPARRGVQLELPPTVRWHHEAHDWSDRGSTPRAPQLEQLITALVEGIATWEAPAPRALLRPA